MHLILGPQHWCLQPDGASPPSIQPPGPQILHPVAAAGLCQRRLMRVVVCDQQSAAEQCSVECAVTSQAVNSRNCGWVVRNSGRQQQVNGWL
jgi:hypothetical protein